MKVRWVKLILGAIAVEAGAIVALVCVVAVFGPKEANEAQRYAEKMGPWIGPIAGAIFSFIGAWLIGRSLTQGHLIHGLLLGLFVAAVDVSLLVAMRAPFEWLFVISDVGKIAAGVIGGLVASRRSGNHLASDLSTH
jgi:hypothetical protein